MANENSIRDVGFLSPQVSHFTARFRKQNAQWFELAERLNRKAQQLLAAVKITVSEAGSADPKFLAFLLLIRTISNYQAVILMAERGLIVEARTLARSCYENVFCLVSLQKFGQEFADKMLKDELHSRKATANWLLQKEGRLDYSDAERAKRLRETVYEIDSEFEKLGRHVFEQIADRAEIGEMYLFYRQLSWDAAHPSVTALNRYWRNADKDPRESFVQWGPDCPAEDVGDTLNMSLPAVFVALISARELLIDTTPDHELTQMWADYKTKLNV